MILNIVIAFAAALLLMALLSSIVRAFGGDWLAVFLVQIVIVTPMAYILLGATFLSLWSAVALGLLPIAVRVLILGYYYHRAKKYLRGDAGDASMWAAEMVTDGDEEFKQAVLSLDEEDIREIAILAEEKEELRELTIERADE
jgi:hypothetical protein